MNGRAPAQPEMEIKRFTAAEFKALQQKMAKYQEAANVVNEFLDFLKQQHEVGDNEGWQLGEGCFVRPVKAADGAPGPSVAAQTARSRPKRVIRGAGKGAAAVLEPVGVVGENGTV